MTDKSVHQSNLTIMIEQPEPVKSASPARKGTSWAELPARRTERMIALVLFAFALALYLRIMARDVLPGDPGEFQFAAWRLGLAHATGYPLYLLAGSAWQHVLSWLGVGPAAALNAFSAVTAAAAVGLFYLLAAGWVEGPVTVRRAAALLAAAMLAANATFWSQALVAEVYALHALFLVGILLALRALDPPAGTEEPPRPWSPVPLCLLLGLSLAHHASTLLLLPGIAAVLVIARRRITRAPGAWLLALAALLLPLLLYLYIPLRSGPEASPWHYPRLGGETIALYAGGWRGFMDFVTGRSISVGFYGTGRALGNLGQAWLLWRLHFGWPGLALAAFGIYGLVRGKRWAVLAATVLIVVAQQLFNLYYAIGDILVYYIPIYVVGCLWIGFGAAELGSGFARMAADDVGRSNAPPNWNSIGTAVVVALLVLPLLSLRSTAGNLDQSGATSARRTAEALLAAEPEQGAVLVSNDRDEIVPLYYVQYVEGRRPDLTGIFPLIAPQARFGDVGTTVATALAAGAPVYLTKPMPGLDVRFALDASQPPLVRVLGDAGAASAPQVVLDQPYGPLALHGYTLAQVGDALEVRLYWVVGESGVPGLFTTTVQAYDAAGEKVGQSDQAAGGVYYPTSLWKPGETIVETHSLKLATTGAPAALLVAMYKSTGAGADVQLLAPAMSINVGGQ